MPEFPTITHVALTVSDLSRSVPWYEQLFGAKPVLDEDTGPFRHVVWLLGSTLVALVVAPTAVLLLVRATPAGLRQGPLCRALLSLLFLAQRACLRKARCHPTKKFLLLGSSIFSPNRPTRFMPRIQVR